MISESENFEYKSEFHGYDCEWLTIIKIIVAMANTAGGTIQIDNIQNIEISEFDTARLDDKVNSYVDPRIQNIISENISYNSIKIMIPNSIDKPYYFKKNGAYKNPKPPPQQNIEFYKGQIWVRHSGKNETATKDDFDRMFREKLAEFLKAVTVLSEKFPINSNEVKIVKVAKDPNIDYPYTAKKLGEMLGKNQNFIAKTANKLGMKDNLKYALKLKNSYDRVVMIKYSNEAFEYLKEFFINNPNYNPFNQE